MSTPELPSTPAAAPVPPANDATSPETSSLTDAFLSGGLPFQAAEPAAAAEGQTTAAPAVIQTVATPVEDSDSANDTFAAQAERNGWNAAQPANQQTTQPSTPARPGGRDYNGLPPEDVAVFKQMSNEAYARLRPVYDAHKAY